MGWTGKVADGGQCFRYNPLTKVDGALDKVVLVMARIAVTLHHVVAPVLEELAVEAGGAKSTSSSWLDAAIGVRIAPGRRILCQQGQESNGREG